MTLELRGAVPQALAKRFGGMCRPVISQVTVGVASTAIVLANMDRVALSMHNFGANDVILSFVPGVTLTRGILLRATIGFVSFDIYEDTILPAWEWFGISALANEITVVETLREVAHGGEI